MPFLKRFRTQPTLFLIGGVLLIAYSVPMMIYSFTLTGGASLIALLYIYVIGISAIAILVDYAFIKHFNFIKVSIIEAFIMLAFYMVYSYNVQTAYINIQSLHKPYLIVINSERGIGKKDFSRCGLFDIEYTINDNDILLLNKETIAKYNLTYKVKDGESGPTESFHYKPEYNFDWDIITPSDSNRTYTSKQQDSILKTKLPPNTIIYNPKFKGY